MMTSNALNIPAIVMNADASTEAEDANSSHPTGLSDNESQLHFEAQNSAGDTEPECLDNADLYNKFEEYLKASNKGLYENFLKFLSLDEFVLRSGFSLFSYGVVVQHGENDKITTMRMPPIDRVNLPKRQTIFNSFRPPKSSTWKPPWQQTTWNTICKASAILKTKKAAGLDIVLLSRRNVPSLQILTYWHFIDWWALSKDDRSQLCSKLWISVLRFLEFAEQDLLTSCFNQDHYIPSRLDVRLPSECVNAPSMKKFNLAWPSSTPSHGALNVHVWQSYRQKAAFDSVAISWMHDSLDKPRQVLLSFEKAEDLRMFSSILDTCHLGFISCCRTSDKTSIGPRMFKHILLIMLQFITIKHKRFLTSMAQNLHSLDMLARNRPGRSKMLHLYYLQDHVERQHEEIQKCLDLVSNYDLDNCSGIPEDKVRIIIEDIEYLKAKSFDTKDEITGMMKRLATFRDFKQAEQNSITGFLIGLYVPLAFVTGFFGMNTTEINGSSWPISRFFEIAVPLMVVTMIAPLIFGTVVRRSAILAVSTTSAITTYWPFLLHSAVFILWLTFSIRHGSNLFGQMERLEAIVVYTLFAVLLFLETIRSYRRFLLSSSSSLWYWVIGLIFIFIWLIATLYNQAWATSFWPWIYLGTPYFVITVFAICTMIGIDLNDTGHGGTVDMIAMI